MSLDVGKLQKVRELAGGIVQAQCPACEEGGHDCAGEHLRIYPDGRFGCCVHPKDGEHRKRIFALAGVRKPGTFTLRLKAPPALPAPRSVKSALVLPPHPSPGLWPPSPVPSGEGLGTFGTVETDSEIGVPTVPILRQSLATPSSGTLGTPVFNPRAHAREVPSNIDTHVHTCKGLETAVPSVPSVPADSEGGAALRPTATGGRLPFLTPGGDLSIPFDSPERYHWWKGGQSVAATLAEVRAGLANKERMKHAAAV